jgi:hypothetical protein
VDCKKYGTGERKFRHRVGVLQLDRAQCSPQKTESVCLLSAARVEQFLWERHVR